MSTVYQCKIVAVDTAGLKIEHRFNLLASDLPTAQSDAGTMLTYYQPATNLQVTSLTVNGVSTTFTQYRSSPGGTLTKRLIMTNRSLPDPVTGKIGSPHIAISDPVDDFLNWWLGTLSSIPTVANNFQINFLNNICSLGGNLYHRTSSVNYSCCPRVIDTLPPGSKKQTGYFFDFRNLNAMTDPTQLLHGGSTPLQYHRSQWINGWELYRDGALLQIYGLFPAGGLPHGSVNGVMGEFVLDDWVSGDATLTIWYTHAGSGSGAIRGRLQYRCAAPGDPQSSQAQIDATYTVSVDTNVHNDITFTLPAANLKRAACLGFEFFRVGNNAADTDGNYLLVVAAQLQYLSDLNP